MMDNAPDFFTYNALDFDFDLNAPEPKQLLAFLRQLWPDDHESIATLQEIFGYCLTGDTRQQKAFLLVGPKRSGKGTIARVLAKLIGADNTGFAAALTRHGFGAGDRLALLLPNAPEYIELVYACSWLGVIAVPLNTRLSAAEIDRVLADASPRGLVRHSSLPVPTMRLSWQLVLDEQPFELRNDSYPNVRYDPEAILALIYTSGTTGRPKGVMVTHANVLSNVHNFNYWMRYREGGVSRTSHESKSKPGILVN